MKTDIQIAQEAEMKHIKEVAVPVSYTHLDVYKRQDLEWDRFPKRY